VVEDWVGKREEACEDFQTLCGRCRTLTRNAESCLTFETWILHTRHLLVKAASSSENRVFTMSSDGLIAPGLFEDLQNKIDDDGKIKDVSTSLKNHV